MKILADFHHSSLLKSLRLLFENRLGHELYRPIGLEWYTDGYWDLWPSIDTANQYLNLDQAYQPKDGTPQLNQIGFELDEGLYAVSETCNTHWQKACTLEYFAEHDFDVVIASIPKHIPLFAALIARYHPKAKLIVQMGNNWNIYQYAEFNVLASIGRQPGLGDNVMFYHQEIDQKLFYPKKHNTAGNIYSFINILQNQRESWDYFEAMEVHSGLNYKSFGGQCRDGNANGDIELARRMTEASLIYQFKQGGDGFGHIIHNAYALGRPVITRKRDYVGCLAEELLVDGTYFDTDNYTPAGLAGELEKLMAEPEQMEYMSKKAAQRFSEVVNYDEEAERIKQWLANLK